MQRPSSTLTLTPSFIWAGVVLLLLVGTRASPQSLAELAKQEKERRAALRGQGIRRFTNVPVPRTPAETGKPEAEPVPSASAAPSSKTRVPPVLGGTPKAASSTAAIGGERLALPSAGEPLEASAASRASWSWRATFSMDWYRTLQAESAAASQFSGRMKFEMGQRPGEGWRALVDVRDRLHGGPRSNNLVMPYDARLLYDRRDHPLGFSIGRMNLYDSAGAGPLLGGVVSYRASPSLSTGGYAGIEPPMYLRMPDPSSQKYGIFTRYLGAQGRTLAASYNLTRFQGVTERQFIYATGLVPLKQPAVIFGSVEYELNPNVVAKDRLSRFFLNARYDLSPFVDVTAYASSGRGLDYRRFVLEQSQNRRPDAAEIERFYYSRQLGARLHVKPRRELTVFVAPALSEQKDRGIKNHTIELGGSLLDFGGSGLSLYGSYFLNRGASAESDSYRISASRDFGSLSWTGTYSSVFTDIRFDSATGVPELLRSSDRRAASNEFFWVLGPALAVSLEHELSSGGGGDENSFFVRIMGRFGGS